MKRRTKRRLEQALHTGLAIIVALITIGLAIFIVSVLSQGVQ